MESSSTALTLMPSIVPVPSTGVLAAETTVPEPTQSPSAATATPTPSNQSAQPPLLSSMLDKSELPYPKLAGSQLLLVVYDAGNTKLYAYEKGSNGIFKLALDPVSASVGRNGVSSNKKEGDGCTPLGLYDLGFAFGNAAKPDTMLSYKKVTAESYWVDDPDSVFYNTWVEGTAKKDWDSAEHLIDMKTVYEYAVVIEYNTNPIVKGKGSAIFLHCGSGPTAGCVAVSRSNMLKMLHWLDPNTKPQILIVSAK